MKKIRQFGELIAFLNVNSFFDIFIFFVCMHQTVHFPVSHLRFP